MVKQVSAIGIQVVEIMREIHRSSMLFIDVKPDNFMFGRAGTIAESKVFVIDMGIAEKYLQRDKTHKIFKMEPVGGTPAYLSLNTHGGATPSRYETDGNGNRNTLA